MTAQVIASQDFTSFADYYRNGQLSHFKQEHRHGGSFQVSMLIVDQTRSEFVDPAIDEISITGLLTPDCRGEMDFGDGWSRQKTHGVGFVGLQPARQECSFRLADDHTLLVA